MKYRKRSPWIIVLLSLAVAASAAAILLLFIECSCIVLPSLITDNPEAVFIAFAAFCVLWILYFVLAPGCRFRSRKKRIMKQLASSK